MYSSNLIQSGDACLASLISSMLALCNADDIIMSILSCLGDYSQNNNVMIVMVIFHREVTENLTIICFLQTSGFQE